MDTHKIFSYIDDIVESYNEPVQLNDGLYFNHKDTIRTIEFYTLSEYLSGNKDELGREKPFFNVVNFRVTTAKTSTDIDVKDIRFEPDSLKYSTQTMIFNKELYKYLKESNFSKTLNDMGYVRPKYGGVLVKKYENKGELNITIVDWNKVDVDPGDITGAPIVETFFLQPSELNAKRDAWENVDEFVEAHNKKYKNKPVKFEIKEISGEFPIQFYPGEENNESEKYARMCFYIGVVGKKKFMLYYEYEKEMRYKYLAWETIPGRGLGRGVVEDGFQAQVWQNDAMISMKNAMDISGKVILATDSQKVSGNAIVGVDNGHIFQLEPNRSITSLNLAPSALPQYERIIDLWTQQYNNTASTYNANTGEAPPAGTPYSQTALLNQVANTPFEYRREEWGIFLNEVLNDWILPFIKKKIKKEHILVSDFDDDELAVIDESIANFETNATVHEKILGGGNVPSPEEYMAMVNGVKQELTKFNKKREIKIPEGYLDIEGKITANITGELKNKAVILQSMDSIFKTIVSTFNPNTGTYSALEDPKLSKIFGSIVEMAGVPITSSQLLQKTQEVQPADLSAVQPVQPMK